jgi:putative phosphoribosyl transferase
MRAAVKAARRQRPATLVVAVPVGLAGATDELRTAADELVCAWTPPDFHSVSQAYELFGQTSDDEVMRVLKLAWQREATGRA